MLQNPMFATQHWKKMFRRVKACSLHRLARYGGSACNPKHWRGQSINAVNFEASLAYRRSSGSRELRLEWELTLRRWAHATLGRPHIHTLKGLSPLCVSMCRCNQLWLVDGVLYTLQPFHKQTNTCKETTVVSYLNKDSGHSKFQIWWKSSTDKQKPLLIALNQNTFNSSFPTGSSFAPLSRLGPFPSVRN